MSTFTIRQIIDSDCSWIEKLLVEQWKGPVVITRGKTYNALELPGFIALIQNDYAGLITYNILDNDCEIVTLNSLIENIGIGSALLRAVQNIAKEFACKRLWLITTNDNLDALRFYQKRGFVLSAIHTNALEYSRRLKPSIPLIGNNGIPLRDEIELEMLL